MLNTLRKSVRWLLLIIVLSPLPALAVDPVYTGWFSSVAIKGYDPVAYFTENRPVKGSDKLSYSWNGADWHFSSEDNLEKFKSDPEKYAPQYGGYCAYAVSQGETAPIEPDQFTLVNGKLYLNYNKSINEKWLKDKGSYIEQADKEWPKLVE